MQPFITVTRSDVEGTSGDVHRGLDSQPGISLELSSRLELVSPLPSGHLTPRSLTPSNTVEQLHTLGIPVQAKGINTWAMKTLGQNLSYVSNNKAMDEGEPVKLDSVRVIDALPSSLSVVLLYFSSRWCPLCVEFDALMQEVYNAFKVLPEGSSEAELVWVSCDVSEAAFMEHLSRLGSVLAVPWDLAKLDEIRETFNILGVPTLLILDASDGHVLSMTGREDVLERQEQTERAAVPRAPKVDGQTPRGKFLTRSKTMPVEEVFSKSQDTGFASLHTHWLSLVQRKKQRAEEQLQISRAHSKEPQEHKVSVNEDIPLSRSPLQQPSRTISLETPLSRPRSRQPSRTISFEAK